MVDTSTTPALGYMEIVPNRSENTLLPIIRDHCHSGTIVWSDMWSAYNNVGMLAPVASHESVNHSVEFVDPSTGVHTQNIESYWNRTKKKLKSMKGCHEHQIPSYLDEFMWRERFGQSRESCFINILGDIAVQYPV